MTSEQIKMKAEDVLNKYVLRGGVHKKFDVIMEAENIKFRKITTTGEFLGVFTRGNNYQPYIMINSNISNKGRENFTIAHELGHYFLCHELKNGQCFDSDILESSLSVNKIEREANYFASCILMPEDKIKKAFLCMLKNSHRAKIKNFLCVKNNFTWGIWCGIRDDLMKRYGVSEAALRYRLSQLKLAYFNFDE